LRTRACVRAPGMTSNKGRITFRHSDKRPAAAAVLAVRRPGVAEGALVSHGRESCLPPATGSGEDRQIECMKQTERSMDILSCLKKYGQRLDSEIAAEMNMSLTEVRAIFGRLAESGEVIACKLTRFENGKAVDALVYRASGYFPRPAAGRKPKPPAS